MTKKASDEEEGPVRRWLPVPARGDSGLGLGLGLGSAVRCGEGHTKGKDKTRE